MPLRSGAGRRYQQSPRLAPIWPHIYRRPTTGTWSFNCGRKEWRGIEYRTAAAAARLGEPSAGFRALPDYESYRSLAGRGRLNLRHELDEFDLGQHKRTSFCPFGPALALLLEANRVEWKRRYDAAPFALTSLLWSGR